MAIVIPAALQLRISWDSAALQSFFFPANQDAQQITVFHAEAFPEAQRSNCVCLQKDLKGRREKIVNTHTHTHKPLDEADYNKYSYKQHFDPQIKKTKKQIQI